MASYIQVTLAIVKRWFFFIVTCFTISTWILITNILDAPVNDISMQEANRNGSLKCQYSAVCRNASGLRKKVKDLKYILIWNQGSAPLSYFEIGQSSFIKNKCSATNCYVTSDREYFDVVTKFDAIAFNGRIMNDRDLPKYRSIHQKYIFFNMESAANYPVCSDRFDGFFNWTSTYKLDSDISFTYILIRNITGDIVGPKLQMQWSELPEVDEDLFRLKNKTKAAAWFVSHCSVRSNRNDYVKNLTKALHPYGYTVDVYGLCGSLKCPKDKQWHCNSMLERDYFFYMSLENSFAEDYVTEKLFTALHHETVPIVYGGADYSRFLPPGAYLDARKSTVSQLAATMHKVMTSHRLYHDYFKWKHQYRYSDPSTENMCAVCSALNDKKKFEAKSVYNQFRKWWYSDYLKRC